jgi:hypothetical protein
VAFEGMKEYEEAIGRQAGATKIEDGYRVTVDRQLSINFNLSLLLLPAMSYYSNWGWCAIDLNPSQASWQSQKKAGTPTKTFGDWLSLCYNTLMDANHDWAGQKGIPWARPPTTRPQTGRPRPSQTKPAWPNNNSTKRQLDQNTTPPKATGKKSTHWTIFVGKYICLLKI